MKIIVASAPKEGGSTIAEAIAGAFKGSPIKVVVKDDSPDNAGDLKIRLQHVAARLPGGELTVQVLQIREDFAPKLVFDAGLLQELLNHKEALAALSGGKLPEKGLEQLMLALNTLLQIAARPAPPRLPS